MVAKVIEKCIFLSKFCTFLQQKWALRKFTYLLKHAQNSGTHFVALKFLDAKV
jgi:hypothetical protein